jgi:hypothetical protein
MFLLVVFLFLLSPAFAGGEEDNVVRNHVVNLINDDIVVVEKKFFPYNLGEFSPTKELENYIYSSPKGEEYLFAVVPTADIIPFRGKGKEMYNFLLAWARGLSLNGKGNLIVLPPLVEKPKGERGLYVFTLKKVKKSVISSSTAKAAAKDTVVLLKKDSTVVREVFSQDPIRFLMGVGGIVGLGGGQHTAYGLYAGLRNFPLKNFEGGVLLAGSYERQGGITIFTGYQPSWFGVQVFLSLFRNRDENAYPDRTIRYGGVSVTGRIPVAGSVFFTPSLGVSSKVLLYEGRIKLEKFSPILGARFYYAF